MADKNKKIEGIGGWLILPTISLFLGAGIWLFNFVIWGLLFSEESGLYELIIFLTSAIIALLAIYSLVLEFKKKKGFPKWAIATLWVSVVATILLSVLEGDYSDVFGITIGVVIWTWYFNVSVRVKNTFVK